jgi:hypothetical protein
MRRELDLKRQIQALQSIVWQSGPLESRRSFFSDKRFVPPAAARASSLAKALIAYRPGELGVRTTLEMVLRGAAIRSLGRLPQQFWPFVESRAGASRAQRLPAETGAR